MKRLQASSTSELDLSGYSIPELIELAESILGEIQSQIMVLYAELGGMNDTDSF